MWRPRQLGYGEGSVYTETVQRRVKGKTSQVRIYRGEITVGGQRRRVNGKTRSEVIAGLDKLRSDAAEGLPIGDDTRLGAWLDWYEQTVLVKKDPNTAANYAWAFSHLKPLRGTLLRDLTPEDVESLLGKLANEKPPTPAQKRRGGHQKQLGDSSIRRIKANLGAALQKAEARNLVSRNVARIAELPKTAPAKEKRSLTQLEARNILVAVSGDRDEAMILVALMLGLRPGEVLGLTWGAVDLKERTLEINQALHRQAGGGVRIGKVKSDSYRTIRLPSSVVDALRNHRIRQKKEKLRAPVWEEAGLVFPSIIGTPVDFSNLRRTVHRVCKKAEVPSISPNELRHSAATLLMEAGVPMQEVSDMFGHTDTRMIAKVYRHKRGVVDVTEGQDRMLGAEG